MEQSKGRRGFLRRRSPVTGVIFTAILAFVLFCIVLCLFIAKCSLGLLSKSSLTSTVTVLLDDDNFRSKVAETIVLIAPEDTLVAEQVAEVMQDEQIAQAVGQLGSEFFSGVIDSESADPVDAMIAALENPDEQETFDAALAEAMVQLDFNDDNLHEAAEVLSEELGFEPPSKDSTNLEVVTTILDGSRDKFTAETNEMMSFVQEAKDATGEIFAWIGLLSTLLGTAVFVLINLLLGLILYGLMILLLRNLWKPCYFLGVPYLLTGALLLCVASLDGVALANQFGLSDMIGALINAALRTAFSTGLIGVIVGAVLIILAITVTIIMNIIYNKKEETLVCSVPNAEIN